MAAGGNAVSQGWSRPLEALQQSGARLDGVPVQEFIGVDQTRPTVGGNGGEHQGYAWPG